ncbi:CHASE2 domain-containing protein [Lewinella sp. 4G2]|uniref:CHASE2 domain-containing protein n=1 Tax=Lewinella sp. 4G2 TaxID=1803372 RepID=UPI0007B47499|nr:CHASE2 domain-containing protein [Lewinella sp. 4G2]OAV43635.1 hypothetical protein A3850_003600 [Lewinella sp. 4G2]
MLPTRSHYIHAAVITVIVLLFISLMKLFTLKVHYFDPFSSRLQDYEVTDILFSQLRDTARVKFVDEIIMVHVPKPDRAQMADLIDKISDKGARVIGVDVLFPGRKDSLGDARLAQSLRGRDNIVLAANLMQYDPATDSISGMITSDSLFALGSINAYTNFLASTNRTVRLFTPWLKTSGGVRQQAFATAIAGVYDPNLLHRMRRRGGRSERINYVGDFRSFIRKDIDEVLRADSPDYFRGRIVLIGYAHSTAVDAPLEDRYYTPLNRFYTGRSIPDMYGMTIHANIIKMIIDGNWIRELPKLLVYLITVVFTFLNVLLIQRIYHRLPDVFHGVTRLLQIAEAILLFLLVAICFTAFDVKLELGIALLAMLMVYDFVMIYENLIRKRIPYLKDLDYD